MRRSRFGVTLIAVLILASCTGPAPTLSPLEAPCAPTTTSKVGLHIVPGRRTGFGTFLQRLADACINLAVVKAVDDLSPLREVERLMPGTLTVGRLNSATDPTTGVSWDLQAFKPDDFGNSSVEAARVYWSLVTPTWIRYPEVDAWELFNEYSGDWGWQSRFYIEMMKRADEAGLKLVLFAFSTGNPPLDASVIDEIAPALRYAMAHGHYVSSHAYGGVLASDPETLEGSYLALYHREWYAMLPEDARPRLIISEAGQSGGCCFIGTERFIEDYRWLDLQLALDDYVVGVAAWTLGNWGSANIQDALPALADYIISLLALDPTPTPTPTHTPTPTLTPTPVPPHEVYLPLTTRGVTPQVTPLGWLALLALGIGSGAAIWRIRVNVRHPDD